MLLVHACVHLAACGRGWLYVVCPFVAIVHRSVLAHHCACSAHATLLTWFEYMRGVAVLTTATYFIYFFFGFVKLSILCVARTLSNTHAWPLRSVDPFIVSIDGAGSSTLALPPTPIPGALWPPPQFDDAPRLDVEYLTTCRPAPAFQDRGARVRARLGGTGRANAETGHNGIVTVPSVLPTTRSLPPIQGQGRAADANEVEAFRRRCKDSLFDASHGNGTSLFEAAPRIEPNRTFAFAGKGLAGRYLIVTGYPCL